MNYRHVAALALLVWYLRFRGRCGSNSGIFCSRNEVTSGTHA